MDVQLCPHCAQGLVGHLLGLLFVFSIFLQPRVVNHNGVLVVRHGHCRRHVGTRLDNGRILFQIQLQRRRIPKSILNSLHTAVSLTLLFLAALYRLSS